MSNIYYWEKLTFSKLCFSQKENLKKCTSFEEQKRIRYIWGIVYFGIIILSCLSSTKPCIRFLLTCFSQFFRWKSNNYNNIVIFLSLKNSCTFLLVKEKTWKSIFNTNSELSQNRTEKQIMPIKTTVNWLLNYIWCYFVIDCLIEKLAFFNKQL